MFFIFTLIATLVALTLPVPAGAYLFAKPGSGDFEASMIVSVIGFLLFGFIALKSKPEVIIVALMFSFFVGAFAFDPGPGEKEIEFCSENPNLEKMVFQSSVSLSRIFQIAELKSQDEDVCLQNVHDGKTTISYFVKEEIKNVKWCLEFYFTCTEKESEQFKRDKIKEWFNRVFETENVIEQRMCISKIARIINGSITTMSLQEASNVKCLLQYVANLDYQIEGMVEDVLFDGKISAERLSEWMLFRSRHTSVLDIIKGSDVKEAFSIKRVLLVVSIASLVYVAFITFGSRSLKQNTLAVAFAIICVSVVLVMF